jgi:hypothetical protein
MKDLDGEKLQEVAVFGKYNGGDYCLIESEWNWGRMQRVISDLADKWRQKINSAPPLTWFEAVSKHFLTEYCWDINKEWLLGKGNFPVCYALFRVVKEGDHFKC